MWQPGPAPFAKTQVAGKRRSLRRDALHQVAVRDDCVGVMIHNFVARTIVFRRKEAFGNRHADPVAEALSERSSRNFHPVQVFPLGVTGCLAAPLAEVFQVIER